MPIAVQPSLPTKGKRILVLLEPGRAGWATIDLARQLAEDDHSTITVVSDVPQAVSAPRCGCAAAAYNAAVRDAAADELEHARAQLREMGDRATFTLLVQGTDPPLREFVAAAAFELVLLPARHRPLRSTKHPAASALRHTGAEVGVVDARAHPALALI